MDIPIEQIEEKWAKKWDEMGLFTFKNDGGPVYTMDIPPPTISGNLHMGHLFSYPHQDFVARYLKLKGYNVYFQFGYDDNGLPTERYTEKITGRKGRDTPLVEFIDMCRESSTEAETRMTEQFLRIGMSADFSRYYRTSSEQSMKTSQSAFIELAKSGRAYSDVGPTMRCPTCRTAIAQIDLKDKDMKTDFVYIRFGEGENTIMIATTRPEMLAACVAVFVNPEDDRFGNLIGREISVPIYGHKVKVIADDYVSKDKGTGAEMVCTFGDQNDIYLWRKHSLETRTIVTPEGTIDDNGPLQGMPVTKARKEVIKKLQASGVIDKIEKITHSVNVHERCDTPIEIGIERQWFIRVLDLKNSLLDYGNRIKWYPEHMKIRYDNWVNGLKWDWCISRQRFFGIPFPVWHCNDCESVIYAREEELPVDPRLTESRKCDECGSHNTSPETDIMDTWATSSLSPRISLDLYGLKETGHPMDIRFQAHDIISTWTFTTVTRSLLHDKDIPWKRILLSGIVSDPTGAKMSKSKGNVTNPGEVLSEYGADAIRFWASSSLSWDDLKFKEQELIRGRRTLIKLYNAAKLLSMLAEQAGLSDFSNSHSGVFDAWILRKSEILSEEADNMMSEFLFSKARSEIDNFFWNTFCDHYLEIAKQASKLNSPHRDSIIGAGLYVLLQIIKMYSPVIPFATEEIYSQMQFNGKKESIYLETWPEKFDISELKVKETEGDYIVNTVTAIRSERAKLSRERKENASVTISGNKRILGDNHELIEGLTGISIKEIQESDTLSVFMHDN